MDVILTLLILIKLYRKSNISSNNVNHGIDTVGNIHDP